MEGMKSLYFWVYKWFLFYVSIRYNKTHMEKQNLNESLKLESPQDELNFLREQVALKEKQIELAGGKPESVSVVKEGIEQYKEVPSEKILHKDYEIPKEETESIVLNLAPEAHDKKMEELLALLMKKGIKNTLSVVSKFNDPHIEDDFHRFLVQYVKKGLPVKGLDKSKEFKKALGMTLYEVALPQEDKSEETRGKTLKELLSSMEQFYAGMLSVGGESSKDNYFALEIANANGSDEFAFYVAVPDSKKDLFEKQILSIFTSAKIKEKNDDYNIFNEMGISVGSYAILGNNPIFPLKTYDKFDYDPINVILNSFSKIDRDGEGAAVQIVFSPAGDEYLKKFNKALGKIEKGEPVKKAINSPEGIMGFLNTLSLAFGSSKSKKKPEDVDKPKVVDEIAVNNIREKISAPIVRCNMRIVASASTPSEAEQILSDIESSFNQFENTTGNKIKWKRLKNRAFDVFLKEFSFRMFSRDKAIPLNLKEISSVIHFNSSTLSSSPRLKQSGAKTASVSPGMPDNGTLIGVNSDRSSQTKVYMAEEDRLRHIYTIGQTGTGKSTLLKNMIIQDMADGKGVCMIDPHGIDVLDVLANVPKNRLEDVIYFDPSFADRPMGLNMLEYDKNHPEQKTFVVNELFSIFQKLYGEVPESMGPMFEQYFRNATTLVIEDPDSGNTLLDVSRVLSNKEFREMKLSKCSNPVVVQFWREIAGKAGGEASLANIVPYITSKFDVFLANEIMRPIIAQEKSSFNFRDILDSKKIMLVNLAKGKLGDINSNLLGLILVGKILMAALSRADSPGKDFPSFYLYIDEFQNVTTDSIATILSEARKYKLSLSVANQFIAQLTEKIRDAVFGNVGSIISFRIGADDAEYLEKQFSPVFTAADLMNIENRNAYVKMLVNGRPVRAFSIETLPVPLGNKNIIENLKKLSFIKYGREKGEVEKDIAKKYEMMVTTPVASKSIV